MLPANAIADRLAVDVQSAQALRAQVGQGDKAALRQVAQQFEAMVVQIMLKTMRETHFTSPDDPMAESDSLKMYREMLDQQWAQKMSSAKGLGFAEMIVKSFSQAEARQAAAAEAGNDPQAEPIPAEMLSAPQRRNDLPAASMREPLPALRAEIPVQSAPAAPTVAPVQPQSPIENDRKRRFLETMRPHAEAAERATGVPARYILAHAALESGWGEREIRDAEGQPSHNLFGIKAGKSWQGESVDAMTTEYRYGLPMKSVERFRAYPGYTEAFTDYAGLIQRRYQAAASAGADADAFARGIATGGYATDPAYAGKLRGVIASVDRVGV